MCLLPRMEALCALACQHRRAERWLVWSAFFIYGLSTNAPTERMRHDETVHRRGFVLEFVSQAVIGVVVAEGMKPASEVPQEDADEIARLLDRANIAAEAPSHERYHLRERAGEGVARGVSRVQNQEGRPLLHREPAQARS